MAQKTKKKKFKLFDMNRDGKGVNPGEDRTPNLIFFFKQFGRKFTKILSLNILMIFQVLPLIACAYIYFIAMPKTPSMADPEFAAILGTQQYSTSVLGMLGLGFSSTQSPVPAYDAHVYWIIIAVILVVFVLTYGLQKVGSVYVTRGLVRGDSVFILSDFFYAIKKNWKQGILLGVIDCVIIGVLAHNLMFFFTAAPSGLNSFVYVLTIALIILYTVFRFYTYLMIVTFNIRLDKVFKNALIFTVVGIKRNILALIGLVIVTAIALIPMLLLLQFGLGVALVLPLIYYLGVCSFIYTYAAYPVIKKYMIDPVDTPKKKVEDGENEELSTESSELATAENE